MYTVSVYVILIFSKWLYIFAQDAQYMVTLVVSSIRGCTDTAQVSVQVFAQPNAQFVTNATQLTFPETEVTLSNTSLAGESAEFYWTFGDGQVSYDAHPANHEYGTWGTYDISLEVSDGACSDVATSAVQILAPPHSHHWIHGRGSWMRTVDCAFQQRKHLRQQLPLGVLRRFSTQRRQSGACPS